VPRELASPLHQSTGVPRVQENVFIENVIIQNVPDLTPTFSQLEEKDRPDSPSVFLILRKRRPTGFSGFLLNYENSDRPDSVCAKRKQIGPTSLITPPENGAGELTGRKICPHFPRKPGSPPPVALPHQFHQPPAHHSPAERTSMAHMPMKLCRPRSCPRTSPCRARSGEQRDKFRMLEGHGVRGRGVSQ